MQQQTLASQQQQQPLLVLSQSQQQQQQQPYLLFQQSEQQPLLMLQHVQQKQEKSQQRLLILQQPQEQPQQKFLLQAEQHPGLTLQSLEQLQAQREQQRQQQEITELDSLQDPLRIFVPVLSLAESQNNNQRPKLKPLKSLKVARSQKIVKLQAPVVKELQLKQEALKMEDPLMHREYLSTHIGSTTVEELSFVQELPSTSDETSVVEAYKAIGPDDEVDEDEEDHEDHHDHNYDHEDHDHEHKHEHEHDDDDDDNLEDKDCKEEVGEDVKEIYTRIDYGGYQCNICQLTRLDRRSMLFHISGQHSHLRPFKCASCDKTFKRKYSLKVHELSHNLTNAVETHPCEKCNYRTPNKVSLRYHYYRVHTNEFRFTCEHCGKRFKVKRELADHLVTHSGIQHMCDICGKLYRGEHLLRAHRRLHLDLYKYQCLMCKKKLATEEGLSNHMKLHSRTYECDECGMKFPSKYNLIKHRNVHTREQAFPCPECGKVFADQPTQKVHSLIHAGLKPYRCNVCGLGFTQRTPMMLHWRKKHPGETDPPPPVILKNILRSIEEQNGKKAQQIK